MLVIRSIDGGYWTGETWTIDPSKAKDYIGTGGVWRESSRLRAEQGIICFPAHIRKPGTSPED
jgi:hypothetical protein